MQVLQALQRPQVEQTRVSGSCSIEPNFFDFRNWNAQKRINIHLRVDCAKINAVDPV
jgi:hypothetical protein